MSAVFFLFGVACGWQFGNTLIKLRNKVPLRWIDWATPVTFAIVAIVRFVLDSTP